MASRARRGTSRKPASAYRIRSAASATSRRRCPRTHALPASITEAIITGTALAIQYDINPPVCHSRHRRAWPTLQALMLIAGFGAVSAGLADVLPAPVETPAVAVLDDPSAGVPIAPNAAHRPTASPYQSWMHDCLGLAPGP